MVGKLLVAPQLLTTLRTYDLYLIDFFHIQSFPQELSDLRPEAPGQFHRVESLHATLDMTNYPVSSMPVKSRRLHGIHRFCSWFLLILQRFTKVYGGVNGFLSHGGTPKIIHFLLVGGSNSKKTLASWDDYFQYIGTIWENKTCSNHFQPTNQFESQAGSARRCGSWPLAA